VDEEILSRYDYPWHKVRAFRNFIAHEYYGIKLDLVLQIVMNEIPVLKEIVKRIIDDENVN
jgi:uncharacterized protein with HEPN domain